MSATEAHCSHLKKQNLLCFSELRDNFSWRQSFCSVFLEIIKSLIQKNRAKTFFHEKFSHNSEIIDPSRGA